MSSERDRIAESILRLLSTTAVPMRGREIAEGLHGSGVNVTRTVVNSILYCELSSTGCVVQDGEYRWAAVGQHACPGPHPEGGDFTPEHPNAEEQVEGEKHSAPEECRAARRVLQVLRSGTTSCRAAKAISVGTSRVERDLYLQTQSLFKDGTGGDMIVIAADWGFGKSHMRMLLSNHLSECGIPFVYECIDARAASLAHIHRSVPRWLDRMRFGPRSGLRDVLSNGHFCLERVVEWASRNYSEFSCGIRSGLGGNEWGWLLALGHLYRSPDYPYQHPKAWALLESVATFLNEMGCGGVVLLLDEAENINRQYDIRGRRRSYETLARMMRHPHILPVLFATDRLTHQVQEDSSLGQAREWKNWTHEAKWFVSRFQDIEPIRPPNLTDRLAEELVRSIQVLYRTAYPSSSGVSTETVLDHWRRTPTRSIRLLVRLTINELDLLAQNGRRT